VGASGALGDEPTGVVLCLICPVKLKPNPRHSRERSNLKGNIKYMIYLKVVSKPVQSDKSTS
jgi:hypothetical protein